MEQADRSGHGWNRDRRRRMCSRVAVLYEQPYKERFVQWIRQEPARIFGGRTQAPLSDVRVFNTQRIGLVAAACTDQLETALL